MKTSKLSTISGIVAIALIVTLALTACPADTNSGGGSETYIADADFDGTKIPIYRSASADTTKAAEMKAKIDGAYAKLGNSESTPIKTKTKKIVIVSGDKDNNSVTKATGVIELGEDCSQIEILGFFATTVVTAFQD
jgi:hypothetical protein